MAAKWVVTWTLPEGMDMAKYDDWYWNHHVPLAKQLPGMRKYTTTLVKRVALGAPMYRMAEQYFDDEAALEAAINSDLGRELAEESGPWTGELNLYVTIEEEQELA